MKPRVGVVSQSNLFNGPSFALAFEFRWALLAAVGLADVVWLACSNWHVQWDSLLDRAMFVAAFYAPLLVGRCRRAERFRSLCEAFGFALAFSTVSMILSYLVVSTAHPLVDPLLAAADRSLGFDWGRYYLWVTSHPGYARAVRIPYDSIVLQLCVVMVGLAVSGRRERLVELVELVAALLVVTVVVSYLFPAEGAAKFYQADYHPDLTEWTHFELLRSGVMRTIDVAHMQGLISMPSYHPVMGLLLCWSVRGTRAAPLVIVLNTAMLLATPVYGGHHVVDVAAGAAATVAAIAVRRRLTMRSGVAGTARRLTSADA